jgi:uncharacterized membrane-anchored protein YjiN (DUF445 family)
MPITISEQTIKEAIAENIAEILKDMLTGYSSPVKDVLTDEDGEVYKSLVQVTQSTFKEIIQSDDFKDMLKDKLLEVAIEKMVSR